jgi:ATP-dependent Clp protease protease subunit
MPIGVPRIIYCWGEELPAQWTDIYNFIFRRRMVFLMQYLDDELCNQICGLLINIHMEDRSKEMEKKEMEKSGLFKNASIGQGKQQTAASNQRDISGITGPSNIQNKNVTGPTFEDLLAADEDLGIQENKTLEDYTLQKITMEWLNWNAQFFDYSDEPYLFYLAEMLSQDFNKNEGRSLYSGGGIGAHNKEMSILMNIFKNMNSSSEGIKNVDTSGTRLVSDSQNSAALMQFFDGFNSKKNGINNLKYPDKKNHLDVYSPFRLLANFAAQDYNLKDINPLAFNSSVGSSHAHGNPLEGIKSAPNSKRELFELFNSTVKKKSGTRLVSGSNSMSKLLTELAQKNFTETTNSSDALLKSSEKALSQRMLRKEYTHDKTLNMLNASKKTLSGSGEAGPTKLAPQSLNYLDFYSYNDSYNEFKTMQRGKQTERALQEEEAKKVFVIINSFGGSVGNGITVHDALQFIKAGSLTLALGVAASAASLALAGGTIGERYVTEGCHVMIHQPEGGIQGQASDIWIDSQEIMKIRLDVAEIYSLATYRPRHKILRDLDRDFYLTATETIHYGLADEIATNEVMNEIIEMTSKVWDYHDTKQQRLLETRDSSTSGLDTQAQN